MRFNKRAVNPRVTTNYHGEKAYRLTPKLELYTAVCCASLQPKFYEGIDVQVDRIRQLIKQVDPAFVAKLAVYAREKMYLRSVPLVLCVEMAKAGVKGSLLRKTVARVIQRADEITEILAYYAQANEDNWNYINGYVKKLRRLSKAIQKGVADAFHKFDEYQFAKYNRDTEIKLRDALFICHPKPRDEKEEELFKKIINKTLEPPYTWEVELSRLGQQKFGSEEEKKEAFKAKWEELIDSGRLGYMALLRNLRNIVEYGVSEAHIQKVCERLSNPVEVKRSKQLPFRFFAAYKEMVKVESFYTTDILEALEKAVVASIENVKGFDKNTKVLIACDVSGSMETPISPKSKVQYYDIGLLLGQLLRYKCARVITGFFGDIWKVVNLPKGNVLQNTLELHRREGEVGYSTNGWKVIEWLNKNQVIVDKIAVFTDCQMWDSSYGGRFFETEWRIYKKINPSAKLYLFDLCGYGYAPLDVVADKDVYLIAGWSDKIFDVLEAVERGEDALSEIEKIAL